MLTKSQGSLRVSNWQIHTSFGPIMGLHCGIFLLWRCHKIQTCKPWNWLKLFEATGHQFRHFRFLKIADSLSRWWKLLNSLFQERLWILWQSLERLQCSSILDFKLVDHNLLFWIDHYLMRMLWVLLLAFNLLWPHSSVPQLNLNNISPQFFDELWIMEVLKLQSIYNFLEYGLRMLKLKFYLFDLLFVPDVEGLPLARATRNAYASVEPLWSMGFLET